MIDEEGSFLGIVGDLDVTIGSDFKSGGTYEIEDISGEPYIVKYGQLRTLADEQKSKDPNYFFSFIGIVENLKNISWENLYKDLDNWKDGNINRYIPINEVKNWCKKNGLLWYEESIYHEYNKICMPLKEFYENAILLNIMFYLFHYINISVMDSDSVQENQLYKISKSNNSNFNIYDDDIRQYTVMLMKYCEFKNKPKGNKYFDVNSIFNMDINDVIMIGTNYCFDFINEMVNDIGLHFHRPRSYPYDKPDLFVYVQWPINTLYYQFGMMLTKPEEVEGNIKRCENCNAYFWGRKNQKYCYKKGCNRKTINSRKKRSGEKGSDNIKI